MRKAVFYNRIPNRVGYIKAVNTHRVKFLEGPKNNARIDQVLPFRVKFIQLGIDAYGPNNPAPIGIAVIGLNNYVL